MTLVRRDLLLNTHAHFVTSTSTSSTGPGWHLLTYASMSTSPILIFSAFSGAPARQAWRPAKQRTLKMQKQRLITQRIYQYSFLQHYLQAVYNCLLSKLPHVTWHNTWSPVKFVYRDCAERHRHLHTKLYCYSMMYCNSVETAVLTLTAKIWLYLSSHSSMDLGLSAPVLGFGASGFLTDKQSSSLTRE